MRRVNRIEYQRHGTRTPPPQTRFFVPSSSPQSDSEWILGLLEPDDIPSSPASIHDIDPVFLSTSPNSHSMQKNKWSANRHNRYKSSTPPLLPVYPSIRRSSSTSELHRNPLEDVNYLTFNSKPKWWSITKLHKTKPEKGTKPDLVKSKSYLNDKISKSEPIDIKGPHKNQPHNVHHAHTLQHIKQKFSSRLHLLKRSLSNRMLLKRRNTSDVVSNLTRQ